MYLYIFERNIENIFNYITYMKIHARKCPEGSDMVQNGPKWWKTCYIHFYIKK